MNITLRIAMAATSLLLASQAFAQVTFYAQEGFQGRSFSTQHEVRDLSRFGFNDRAASAVVARDRWEVCEDVRFGGRCIVLRPGRYASLESMGLGEGISSVRTVNRSVAIDNSRFAPAPVVAHVVFYENEGFAGRTFTAERQVENFANMGFNDRASSVVVVGDRWEVCDDSRFRGRCVVLRPGRYASLSAMGLDNRVSSVRAVSRNARLDNSRYAPAPVAVYDYRRRDNEQLFQANVTSVRAVVGALEQRCWIEREQVSQDRSGANVPGAVIGAILGGVLGHQVGNGRGNDVATAVGALAGGAVGANVGRDGNSQQVVGQDVQRCASTPSQSRPQYWDVTYEFRGREYRMQMTNAPGTTVTVNSQGEPRA
jgi:uncharacterized protein YcfJ